MKYCWLSMQRGSTTTTPPPPVVTVLEEVDEEEELAWIVVLSDVLMDPTAVAVSKCLHVTSMGDTQNNNNQAMTISLDQYIVLLSGCEVLVVHRIVA